MSRKVTLYEAQTKLAQLIEDAARGEEIVIAKNGKPLVKLIPAHPASAVLPPVDKGKRKLGQWAKYLTPEQRKQLGSAEWWRRWQETDAEILRDFKVLREEAGGHDTPWSDTSSIPTPSSARNSRRGNSAGKRSKR
jgi:prevent-host-death family protein